LASPVPLNQRLSLTRRPGLRTARKCQA